MSDLVLIDTLRVGGEISNHREGVGWSIFTTTTDAGYSESGRLRSLEGGARLHLISGTAWVEGSVPKSTTGVNYPAATISTALEAADSWISEAREWVDFETEEFRVNRLDVVRDFVLEEGAVGTVLGGLSRVPVMGRKIKAAYADASRGHAETVMVRTKTAGAGRLYDKAKESPGVAPGVVRFEAEERKRSLRAVGISTVTDLEDYRIERLARSRFEWCGFDAEFSGWDILLEKVMGDEELTEGQRIGLVGWYSLNAAGYSVDINRNRSYRFRRLASRYGLPAESEWRLDFDLGLVAAA